MAGCEGYEGAAAATTVAAVMMMMMTVAAVTTAVADPPLEIHFNGAAAVSVVASVSYDDFAKLDIRVARVTAAEPIEGKSRIVRGRIDLGDGDRRDVIIGGAQYYLPGDIVGKTVVVIANLEPKRMAGVESDAMLLAADVDDKPFWLTVDSSVPAGSRVK